VPKQARRWVKAYLLCQYANKTPQPPCVNNVALIADHFGGSDVQDGANCSFTFNAAHQVAAGNTVLVGIAMFVGGGGGHVFTQLDLTQSGGTAAIGPIALDAAINFAANDFGLAIFRVPITAPGTLTLTFGPPGFVEMGCAEFSGLAAVPFEASFSNNGNSIAESSGSMATSTCGLMFYAASEASNEDWVRQFSDQLIYSLSTGATTSTSIFQFKLINSSPTVMTSSAGAAEPWKVLCAKYKTS
jgi:hypothetical protein